MSKACRVCWCRRLVRCVLVSKACRSCGVEGVCGCRRLVECGVEGL